jgi:hypothetical protein
MEDEFFDRFPEMEDDIPSRNRHECGHIGRDYTNLELEESGEEDRPFGDTEAMRMFEGMPCA